MIDYVSKCSTDMLLKNRIIDKEDYDVYYYGMQVVYSLTIKMIALLAISYYLGILVEVSIFLVHFALLRNYAGGRHADSYLICFLVTSLISIIPVYLIYSVPILQSIYFIIVAALVTVLLLFKFAPVDTPNKPIYGEQRKVLHRRSIILGILLNSIIIVLFLLVGHHRIYCTVASTALLVEALTLLPIFNKIKKEVREEE